MFKNISPVFLILTAVAITIPNPLASLSIDQVTLISSYDGTPVQSTMMIPTNYKPAVPTPVLFIFHGANSTNGHDMIRRFRFSTDTRGWIVATPNMHGENILTGQFSFGARAAQHDVIDLLQYLRENYNVDNDRIYLTGPSMGGGMTSAMAQKYPHVFTAGVEWMGYADMAKLHTELVIRDIGWLVDGIEEELGGTPQQIPYEYDRRTPTFMAMNLKHFPFAVGHGENDNVIGPWHATMLHNAIEQYDPLYYFGIFWHGGGHILNSEHVEWICDFLDDYTTVAPPEDIFMQVDESKDYYYVDIIQDDDLAWSIFDVDVTMTDQVDITLENISGFTLHAEETNLDPAVTISLTLHPEAQHTLTVTGLIDTLPYTLMYLGTEYGTYTYDNGIMTIEIPDGSPAVMDFQIVPQS